MDETGITLTPDMLDFGQADKNQYQALTNGLSYVEQKEQDGTFTPEQAQQGKQDILQSLIPLKRRKEAAEAKQYQTYTQQALGQMAMEDGVMFAKQQHAAQHFLNGIASVNNPMTGDTAMYAQTKPGEFEKIDFGESDRPIESNAEPASGTEPPQSATEVPPSQAGPMDIWNGPHHQHAEYDASGHQTSYQGDSYRQPGQQQAQANEGEYLSDHERTVNRNKAEQDYRGMRESANKRRDVAAAERHYNRITAEQNRDKATAGTRATAAEKAVQARKDLQESKKNADLTAKQRIDLFDKRLSELQKEYDVISKPHLGKDEENPRYLKPEDRPAWAKDRDTMEAEAQRRADADHARYYPHRKGDVAATTPSAESAGPVKGDKTSQQKAFDVLMGNLAAPRPTPKPAPPTQAPFDTEEYRRSHVGKFD